ncbi:MAG TPA: LysR family transcriptional regulator [Xanthobacteraceae bacterium]|nr:LysR family transcriptional regulator [Xanthobacteraceae bacterium]
MTNIPTELLRTFVAVVDLRGFTKAAQALGCTQPAVSAQIKRLQNVLGIELLDKSAPGVILTQKGQAIADCARRLLAINDEILGLATLRTSTTPLRIGIAGDFGGTLLPAALADFRRHAPHQAFHVRCEVSNRLLRGLRQGEIDLAVACVEADAPVEARDRWSERVVWVRGGEAGDDPAVPVPLVARDDGCLLTKLSIEALDRAGRDWEMVFTAASSVSVAAAVAAGLGVSAMIERLVPAQLTIWRDPPLPPLPDITCGIYLREGEDRGLLEELAEALAAAIRPSAATTAPAGSISELRAG